MMKSKQSAFTLIELLVTVSLIGLAMIIVSNKLILSNNVIKQRAVESDFRQYKLALTEAAKETNGYQSDIDTIIESINTNLFDRTKLVSGSNGIVSVGGDPWGHAYECFIDTPNQKIQIISLGKNEVMEDGSNDDYVIEVRYEDGVIGIDKGVGIR